MKQGSGNRYATNKGGIIKAPKSVQEQPKATVVKGNDLSCLLYTSPSPRD